MKSYLKAIMSVSHQRNGLIQNMYTRKHTHKKEKRENFLIKLLSINTCSKNTLMSQMVEQVEPHCKQRLSQLSKFPFFFFSPNTSLEYKEHLEYWGTAVQI